MKIIPIKISFRTLLLGILALILILSSCFLAQVLPRHSLVMNKKNFTTLLQDIHCNTFDYSGDSIKLSGYVFRLPDFKNNQFVIARNMMISDTEYRVVGFLCEYDGETIFETDTWVKAEGIITLADYHGPIPIIHLTKICHAKIPDDVTVLPPSQK